MIAIVATTIKAINARTKINIKAWGNNTQKKFDNKLWEINDIGYEVEMYWDYLKLTILL